MSFGSKDNVTATLERPTTEKEFAELVDKKVEQNTKLERMMSEVERETARFETSHSASNLSDVYNEIDRQTIDYAQDIDESEAEEIVAPSSVDELSKMRQSKSYQDVVRTLKTPTIEIDEVEASKSAKVSKKSAKKSNSRAKLWLITGACCLCLLVGLVVCNALEIGNIERQTAMTESELTQQEQVLDGLNGQISAESSKVPENMSNVVRNGGEIDISPTVNTEIVTTDNFFNKLAKFISYLFGR